MPGITVKNLPETLHAQLKERARRHHRSLNGEVLAVLHEAVAVESSTRPPPLRHRPLPAFHGGVQIPTNFDLDAAIRAENAKDDEAAIKRLFPPAATP